jgi:hypothetical protein
MLLKLEVWQITHQLFFKFPVRTHLLEVKLLEMPEITAQVICESPGTRIGAPGWCHQLRG